MDRERGENRRSDERSSRESWAQLLIPVALILGLALLLSINRGTAGPTARTGPLDEWLTLMIGYLAAAAEIAAGLVIGAGILQGVASFVRALLVSPPPPPSTTEVIRLRLGRSLALGLEFTVASDILRTAVTPSSQDILNLGAIVLLRSLLNYFLEREIRQGEQSRGQQPDGEA